jgi:hypothetical protein
MENISKLAASPIIPRIIPEPSPFVIMPTTPSVVLNMSIILFMFLLYIGAIAYISLYDASNIPNIRMFIDFITDNAEPITKFNEYIENSVNTYSSRNLLLSNLTRPADGKETFVVNNSQDSPNAPYYSSAVLDVFKRANSLIRDFVNSMFARSFVNGKTIRITRKINL